MSRRWWRIECSGGLGVGRRLDDEALAEVRVRVELGVGRGLLFARGVVFVVGGALEDGRERHEMRAVVVDARVRLGHVAAVVLDGEVLVGRLGLWIGAWHGSQVWQLGEFGLGVFVALGRAMRGERVDAAAVRGEYGAVALRRRVAVGYNPKKIIKKINYKKIKTSRLLNKCANFKIRSYICNFFSSWCSL